MRGKQVSPPAPFRKVALGSRLEVATHTAGVNPAYLVTQLDGSLPLAGRVGRGSGLLRGAFGMVRGRVAGSGASARAGSGSAGSKPSPARLSALRHSA